MTKPLRVAFLGVDHPHGAGWRDLLSNLSSEVALVALAPAMDGSCCSLQERYAELPCFASTDDLLAWGAFDAAVVCLPNHAGPAAVVQLAQAGKHVLAEKPVAACAADFESVLAAVEQSGIVFQHGYMWRYDQAADRLRAMIQSGRFGTLIHVDMSFVTSDVARRDPRHYLFDPAASGAGFFNWLGCHYLDLLMHVTQQRVVGVMARTGVFGATPVPVDDGGAVILELEEGTIATFSGGYWLPRWAGTCRWTLHGSQRWVDWHPVRTGTGGVLEIHGPQPQWYAMEETFTLPPDVIPGYGGRNGLALVRAWLSAIDGDTAQCRHAARSCWTTLQLLDAVYESSRTGQRVSCSLGFSIDVEGQYSCGS